jgi:hypothetical protein
MMRNCLLFVFIFGLSLTTGAQDQFKRNDLYFEFLGNGIWSSISYERQLTKNPGLGIRVGIGYFSGDEVFSATIPLGLNYLFPIRNNKSFFEAGVGATWANAAGMKSHIQSRNYNEHIWSWIPGIGYRRHTKGNFMWRTSFTPVFNKYRIVSNIGLSVGKRF